MARLQQCVTRSLLAVGLAAAWIGSAGAAHAAENGPSRAESRVSEYAIPVAKVPRDPVPHGTGVYFSMSGADRIARFDPVTQQFREWPVPGGARPHGVAVTEDGTIYYAGFGDSSIGELDPRTGVVQRHSLPRPESRPYSVTVDAQGNVWATLRTGAVAMLERQSRRVTEYGMDGEPYGLAFDRTGSLWVTCIAADKLRRFNPKSGVTAEVAFEKGSKPRRLAMAADGKVWVTLYGTGQVAMVDGVTMRVVKTYAAPGGPNAGPYSVAVGRDGRVWITEFQTSAIAILDPATGVFQVLRLPARSGVRNASMDAQGNFWFISSATGTIGVAR